MNRPVVNFIIILTITLLFYVKNVSAKNPEYSADGSYTNIGAFKHDVLKDATAVLIPMFIFGTLQFTDLLNFNNMLGGRNLIGNIVIATLSYAFYYHVIEPMVANKFQNF